MNAFDTAVEVLNGGFTGREAFVEWMDRINQRGERYCPLAAELIFASAVEEESSFEEEISQVVVEPTIIEPLFSDQFSFAGVPGEPFVEEVF